MVKSFDGEAVNLKITVNYDNFYNFPVMALLPFVWQRHTDLLLYIQYNTSMTKQGERRETDSVVTWSLVRVRPPTLTQLLATYYI